jgi:hypothetical protein
MTIHQADRSLPVRAPAAAPGKSETRAGNRPGALPVTGTPEIAQRVAVLAFGLIQLLLGARIALLAVDARAATGFAAFILDGSQLLVAPFGALLGTDSLHAVGPVLDPAAALALVGWTVIELIAIRVIGTFRRDPA